MKSLHKALDIIDAVGKLGKAGIRDISLLTGIPPATTHRIASTLAKRRYFNQDPVTKQYSISLRFLELGSRVQQQFDLPEVARPHLQRLMTETKESANLVVLDGDEVVYLDQVPSNKSMLKIFTQLGTRAPLYCTGVGKMFLSQSNEEDLEAYFLRTPLVPRTPHTLISRSAILEELKWISRRGYSVDNEETEEGVRCVAALVFDHHNVVAGAVSVSGTTMRIKPERIDYFGKSVLRCANAISRDLGYK
jgi:IclR family transcriptional regulator, KDG regulon repressor